MVDEGRLLARGAEAVIYRVESSVVGEEVIRKIRVPKSYRHPKLDQQMRVRRTRNEARLLHQAKAAGVRILALKFKAGIRIEFISELDVILPSKPFPGFWPFNSNCAG